MCTCAWEEDEIWMKQFSRVLSRIKHWVELLDIRDLASVNSPTPRFSFRGGEGCSQTKEDLISDREVIMTGLECDFTLVVSSLRLSKHQSLLPTVLFFKKTEITMRFSSFCFIRNPASPHMGVFSRTNPTAAFNYVISQIASSDVTASTQALVQFERVIRNKNHKEVSKHIDQVRCIWLADGCMCVVKWRLASLFVCGNWPRIITFLLDGSTFFFAGVQLVRACVHWYKGAFPLLYSPFSHNKSLILGPMWAEHCW